MILDKLKYPLHLTIILSILFCIAIYITIIYHNNFTIIFKKINSLYYIISTILSIISFLPFFYFINITQLDKYTIYNIFITIFIMLTCFIYWFVYIDSNFSNLIFIIIIIIANINLIYILLNYKDENINKNKNKNKNKLKILSTIGLFYLLFHHIFIDFLILGK